MLEIFMEHRLAADDQHFLYSFDNFVSVIKSNLFTTQELCAPLIYLLILSYKLQNLKLTKSN